MRDDVDAGPCVNNEHWLNKGNHEIIVIVRESAKDVDSFDKLLDALKNMCEQDQPLRLLTEALTSLVGK